MQLLEHRKDQMELSKHTISGPELRQMHSARRTPGIASSRACAQQMGRFSARRAPRCSDHVNASRRRTPSAAAASDARGAMTCPAASNGRRRSMGDSGSRSRPADQPAPAAGACPTLSHVSGAGETPEMRAKWTFVSRVSPVSPNLELIEKEEE